jgi:hypothetical protein
MGDPFLNYFALFVLVFVVVVLFYGIIAIHDVPPHYRQIAQPSPSGCDPCGGVGQSVHASRDLAVPLDLGDGVQAGARLGLWLGRCIGHRATGDPGE